MIFLHSSFRASSTWLWSRFRVCDQVVAFYEVFHEQLATITKAQLVSLNPDRWHSKHPSGPPYFLEFEPLMKEGGGIEKYAPAMAFDLFIPAAGMDGPISAAERIYLGSLLECAEGRGKIPLLSCKRSLGRMRAIKSAFSGFHVLIYRNLFQQWCSYTDQFLNGEPFFFNTIRKTIDSNQHDPFFRYLRERFRLADLRIDSNDYFYCFVLLHLYLYAQAADAADLIIDVNQIAADTSYRTGLEQQIADTTGVCVDFSDAKSNIAYSFAGLGSFEKTVSELAALGDLVMAPSVKAKEFVSKCVAELIEEYARYNHYASAVATEFRRVAAERDALLIERDRLRAQLNPGARRLTAPVRALRHFFNPP